MTPNLAPTCFQPMDPPGARRDPCSRPRRTRALGPSGAETQHWAGRAGRPGRWPRFRRSLHAPHPRTCGRQLQALAQPTAFWARRLWYAGAREVKCSSAGGVRSQRDAGLLRAHDEISGSGSGTGVCRVARRERETSQTARSMPDRACRNERIPKRRTRPDADPPIWAPGRVLLWVRLLAVARRAAAQRCSAPALSSGVGLACQTPVPLFRTQTGSSTSASVSDSDSMPVGNIAPDAIARLSASQTNQAHASQHESASTQRARCDPTQPRTHCRMLHVARRSVAASQLSQLSQRLGERQDSLDSAGAFQMQIRVLQNTPRSPGPASISYQARAGPSPATQPVRFQWHWGSLACCPAQCARLHTSLSARLGVLRSPP